MSERVPHKMKKIRPKDIEQTMFAIIVSVTEGAAFDPEETSQRLGKDFGYTVNNAQRPLVVFEVNNKGVLLRLWFMQGSPDDGGCDLCLLDHDCKMGRRLLQANKSQISQAVKASLEEQRTGSHGKTLH